MATRPTRPGLSARYDRRRQEVVDASARVFAQHGYDQTTIAQLSEQVGLAAGGLYHYFPGKEGLLIAVCDRLMDPLLEEADALLADDRPADEQLRALVRLWVAHVVAHRDHMLVFQQERHVIEHGEQWKDVRDARKAFERRVEDVLARCSTRVEDRRLALSALLGMVNHTAQWFRPRGRLTPEQVADGYVDLVLTG